jgi:DNA-directed RNA polymerase beta subunit
LYAGKGVSIVLPDEFRPIALNCNKPIDCIFNSFGVYSRMNISQLLEGVVSKEVMEAEERIINNPNNSVNEVKRINEDIIKHFNSKNYYDDVNNFIQQLEQDKELQNKFNQDVQENGFFIEAPSFSEINIKEIIRKNKSFNEDIKITKETLNYFKDKLKIDLPFTINGDIILRKKFCAPIYTMKLYKLVSEIVTARDLGKCKFITKQPLRGRVNEGGKRLGQMEIENNLTVSI